MSKTKLKGLWVPMEVIADNNLSDKEKFIYLLLLVYSTKKGSTTITNKIISQMFFVSKTQVSKLISSLKRKNAKRCIKKINSCICKSLFFILRYSIWYFLLQRNG
jgi:hypothetical protein